MLIEDEAYNDEDFDLYKFHFPTFYLHVPMDKIMRNIVNQLPDVMVDRRACEVDIRASKEEIENLECIELKLEKRGSLDGYNFFASIYAHPRSGAKRMKAEVGVWPGFFKAIKDHELHGFSEDYIRGQMAAYNMNPGTITKLIEKANQIEFVDAEKES